VCFCEYVSVCVCVLWVYVCACVCECVNVCVNVCEGVCDGVCLRHVSDWCVLVCVRVIGEGACLWICVLCLSVRVLFCV
jgi:hypothetical protein